ncbi:MAG: CBS domain-containing protein [Candidatus Thorarchaeota archaeon]
MLVKDFMTSIIITAEANVLVSDAAKLMAIERIGSFIVTQSEALVGLVTRHDILAARLMSDETYVSLTLEEIMQTPVISISPESDLDQLISLMNQTGNQHVPVMSSDEVIGIVSSTDVIRVLATMKLLAKGVSSPDEDEEV